MAKRDFKSHLRCNQEYSWISLSWLQPKRPILRFYLEENSIKINEKQVPDQLIWSKIFFGDFGKSTKSFFSSKMEKEILEQKIFDGLNFFSIMIPMTSISFLRKEDENEFRVKFFAHIDNVCLFFFDVKSFHLTFSLC